MAKRRREKRKTRKNIQKAVAHIKASFNNTIISVSDAQGNVVAWDSAGTIGYKGSRKSTPFAAQRAGESVGQKAMKCGITEVDVRVKGPGAGRESAIRALQASGLNVRSIQDVTPLPHNGCRPKKKRRV
ncbi:MAG: 30S ribosomal protein S11 [Planctomycetota bacterium]|jgi:small subunit ribosomal protein S11